MIYIACALYQEALPWIEQYQLKKRAELTKFQIFEGTAKTAAQETLTVRLVITGTGPLAAAAACAYLCTLFEPEEGSIFINFGICAKIDGEGEIGETFIVHKVTGGSSGRQYYPDMFYTAPVREAALISFDHIYRGEPLSQKADTHGTLLADMEAEGLFYSAGRFLALDRMVFIKVISDISGEEVSDRTVRQLCRQSCGQLFSWIEEIAMQAAHDDAQMMPSVPGKESASLFDELCEHMKASRSMRETLKRHLYYYELCGGSAEAFLKAHRQAPCRSKNEGKAVMEQLLECLKQ